MWKHEYDLNLAGPLDDCLTLGGSWELKCSDGLNGPPSPICFATKSQIFNACDMLVVLLIVEAICSYAICR